jgi:hypothetical protein
MKSFFANMNLARWIIVASVAGTLVLAFTGWKLHSRRVELERALEVAVPNRALALQVQARRYSKLYKEAEREGLKGQADPESYIRTLASDEHVALGQVEVIRARESTPRKGVADRKYTIRPQSRDRGFPRDRIANFMWKLESESRRVRVTMAQLDPEKPLKPHEHPTDSWKWTVEVTSRQKQDEPPAAR